MIHLLHWLQGRCSPGASDGSTGFEKTLISGESQSVFREHKVCLILESGAAVVAGALLVVGAVMAVQLFSSASLPLINTLSGTALIWGFAGACGGAVLLVAPLAVDSAILGVKATIKRLDQSKDPEQDQSDPPHPAFHLPLPQPTGPESPSNLFTPIGGYVPQLGGHVLQDGQPPMLPQASDSFRPGAMFFGELQPSCDPTDLRSRPQIDGIHSDHESEFPGTDRASGVPSGDIVPPQLSSSPILLPPGSHPGHFPLRSADGSAPPHSSTYPAPLVPGFVDKPDAGEAALQGVADRHGIEDLDVAAARNLNAFIRARIEVNPTGDYRKFDGEPSNLSEILAIIPSEMQGVLMPGCPDIGEKVFAMLYYHLFGQRSQFFSVVDVFDQILRNGGTAFASVSTICNRGFDELVKYLEDISIQSVLEQGAGLVSENIGSDVKNVLPLASEDSERYHVFLVAGQENYLEMPEPTTRMVLGNQVSIARGDRSQGPYASLTEPDSFALRQLLPEFGCNRMLGVLTNPPSNGYSMPTDETIVGITDQYKQHFLNVRSMVYDSNGGFLRQYRLGNRKSGQAYRWKNPVGLMIAAAPAIGYSPLRGQHDKTGELEKVASLSTFISFFGYGVLSAIETGKPVVLHATYPGGGFFGNDIIKIEWGFLAATKLFAGIMRGHNVRVVLESFGPSGIKDRCPGLVLDAPPPPPITPTPTEGSV